MKTQLIFVLFIIVLAQTLESKPEQPSPPIWADQWQQNFEDYWLIDDQEVQSSGVYYYDAINLKQNVFRENSQADGLCSTLTTEQEPCSQYVDQGKRYIYFQNSNECCYCCDALHGCGILKPGWMAFADFDGVEGIDDQLYDVWQTFDGPDPVYTYYNQESGIQSAIYRPGNQELIIYDQSSYQDFLSNSNIVDLPSVCSVDNVCGGKCTKFQSTLENIE